MAGKITLQSQTSRKTAVDCATVAPLPTNTYNNGNSGISATLTGNSNSAFPTIDGVAPFLDMRVLVKDETSENHNGIYLLTTIGSGSAPYVLTRAFDFNTSGNILPASDVVVSQGTTNSLAVFVLTAIKPIVVGTTNLIFTTSSNDSVMLAGDNNGPSNDNVATLARQYRKLIEIGW